MRLSCIVVFALIAGCGSPEQKVVTEFLASDAPTNQLWDMETMITDSGVAKSKIKAGYAAKYGRAGDSRTFLDSSVYVENYDEAGTITSVLTCQRGIIDDVTKDMEAFNKVRVVNSDGTILESEYLKFTQSTGLLSSDKFVTITKPDQVLRGTGFESDRNIRNFRIFKASGEVDVKP